MTAPNSSRRPLLHALRAPQVWKSAFKISLGVGLLQVGINQGEYWLRGMVTTSVVIKTVLTPLVTFGVALASAVSVYRNQSTL